MSQKKIDIDYFASLARLSLTPKEKENISQDIQAILGMADQLSDVHFDESKL